MAGQFEKIAAIRNEIEALCLKGELEERRIPHAMQSYYDLAYADCSRPPVAGATLRRPLNVRMKSLKYWMRSVGNPLNKTTRWMNSRTTNTAANHSLNLMPWSRRVGTAHRERVCGPNTADGGRCPPYVRCSPRTMFFLNSSNITSVASGVVPMASSSP